MKSNSGFSLVEAIVALVVLSLVFTSVWGWFSTATTTTKKVEQALSLPEVFSQFTTLLELESLQQLRNGVYEINEFQVIWQANVKRQSNQETYRRQPQWVVTLFDVNATIERDGVFVSEFATQIVKQWEDPDYVAPPEF